MAESDSAISDPPESPSQMISRRRNRLVNIIKQNDLHQLRQFIAICPPEDVIASGTPYLDDALSNAASYGSPDALRLLLERFNPTYRLLLDACGAANIGVVRFMLDRHGSPENRLPLGPVDLHQRGRTGETPILLAAGSLTYLDSDAEEAEDEGSNVTEWMRDRIAQGHQLIHLLLDLGCSPTDVVPRLPEDLSPWGGQVQDSVLGLAVSRADAPLIQRLIDSGADIYLKHQHFHHTGLSFHFRTAKGHAYDVTMLHLASVFYNTDAVKLLLDCQRSLSNSNPDLASSCDNDGRLPLHWAASGPGGPDCRLPDQQRRITETLRLLLDHDPTGIDLVDKTGSTPLHYAAMSHARCGCSEHAELAIRTLLEYNADPRIPDGSGRTVLQSLRINHAEANGKTALHVFAQNLRQVSAAKFLIEHGADIRARNTSRETPFHAAARGFLNDHVRRDGRDQEVTTCNKIRLQDEMMRALQEAARGDAAMLMSQPNAEGKTPQDLLEETRNRWQGRGQPVPGLGRGRGRDRRLSGGV
ncbi:ankyrin repeat-containing domain protein [Aspergillus spinulosporus]